MKHSKKKLCCCFWSVFFSPFVYLFSWKKKWIFIVFSWFWFFIARNLSGIFKCTIAMCNVRYSVISTKNRRTATFENVLHKLMVHWIVHRIMLVFVLIWHCISNCVFVCDQIHSTLFYDWVCVYWSKQKLKWIININ